MQTRHLAVAMLALLPGLVAAQELMTEQEPLEYRRYTVEMIIFSYAQDVSIGSEIFVPDEPPPGDPLALGPLTGDSAGEQATDGPLVSLPQFVDDESGLNMPETVESQQEDEQELQELEVLVPPPYNPYAPRNLDADNFELHDIVAELSRLDAYRPLLHFGWTQAMLVDEEPQKRPLIAFATPPDGLRGDLSLYLSRYLHLAVDLEFDAAKGDSVPDGGASYDDRRYDSYDYSRYDDAPLYADNPPAVIYRIEEDRIFKNGDLRYFDHPKFGVLAKVTRIEEDDESDDMDIEGTDVDPGDLLGDGELLGDSE